MVGPQLFSLFSVVFQLVGLTILAGCKGSLIELTTSWKYSFSIQILATMLMVAFLPLPSAQAIQPVLQ